MNEILKLILSLSLSGSILAVLLFAVKPLIKHKLSKSIQYYIWIVVLLRLILPFSIEGSIMNNVFYGEQTSGATNSQNIVLPMNNTKDNTIGSSISPSIQKKVSDGIYNTDVDHSRYFRDLFNQYALFLWLLGAIIILMVNLTGYARFLKHIRKTNKPATDEQNKILEDSLNGRYKVRLVRNHFVTTPMLFGVLRPYIIIPDVDFDEKQLKNILLHELSHLRHFDIGVKWLTMIALAIHWFNPIMYLIKKEINHACELACDEAVIKNLSSSEKQAYGDTLISVVAEHKCPIGVLQATMCEEKKSLKERLISIMNYNKKSKPVIIFSGILLGFIVLGAVYLGAGVGVGKNTPPNIYISAEDSQTKVARIGTYSWSYHGKHIEADSDHPMNFEYESDNIVSVTGKQQLVVGTQQLKSDKKYNFAIEQISVYKDKKLVEFELPEPSFMNGDLYIQAPPDAGEYIYELVLSYKDRGKVSYGFVVRVDMLTYDLNEISKHKTPYVGDNSKVSAIAGHLPVPDNYFIQQYTSMKTSEKPYGLTIYYEAKLDKKYEGEWPIVTPDSAIEQNSRANALVAFSMIDNLDEVTFAFRNSKSDGKLDQSKYNTTFTFPRKAFEEKYGDLSVLGENLDLLEEALKGKMAEAKENKQDISPKERQRIDLYIMALTAAFQVENGGDGFIAVKLDTLEGLSEQGKEEVLKALTSFSPNVYSFENVKNDNTKFELDNEGRLIRSIDGTLLYVKVEEYNENKAKIIGVSWFGNLGAVFPKYEATFKNGKWELKLISMAIS